MRRPQFEITVPLSGTTAYVHTRVELFYRRFLEEVDIEYNNDEDLFEAHLKAIIWGVLYVEGLVNYKLYEFTAAKFARHDLVENYWELTRQASVQDKLDLVFASDGLKRPWLKDLKKKFMKMVNERNRLVHLKEVPTPFDLPALVCKLGENASAAKWSECSPYPRIVTHLLAESLHARIDTFLSIGDALERVHTKG